MRMPKSLVTNRVVTWVWIRLVWMVWELRPGTSKNGVALVSNRTKRTDALSRHQPFEAARVSRSPKVINVLPSAMKVEIPANSGQGDAADDTRKGKGGIGPALTETFFSFGFWNSVEWSKGLLGLIRGPR